MRLREFLMTQEEYEKESLKPTIEGSTLITFREVVPLDWNRVWKEYNKYKHYLDADDKRDRDKIQELVGHALKGKL